MCALRDAICDTSCCANNQHMRGAYDLMRAMADSHAEPQTIYTAELFFLKKFGPAQVRGIGVGTNDKRFQ